MHYNYVFKFTDARDMDTRTYKKTINITIISNVQVFTLFKDVKITNVYKHTYIYIYMGMYG